MGYVNLIDLQNLKTYFKLFLTKTSVNTNTKGQKNEKGSSNKIAALTKNMNMDI